MAAHTEDFKTSQKNKFLIIGRSDRDWVPGIFSLSNDDALLIMMETPNSTRRNLSVINYGWGKPESRFRKNQSPPSF